MVRYTLHACNIYAFDLLNFKIYALFMLKCILEVSHNVSKHLFA